MHCSKIFKVEMVEKKRLLLKTHSMEKGYKYLTFIVALVCVLNLCSVNFRKFFLSFFRQAKTCHTLTVAGMMSSAKNKPFLKGYLDFGKLVWASCYNRFCLLSPLLYSFLNLLRIQEQLKLWNRAESEPKTPIISLIILSSFHTHSNKHSTSLCTIYLLNWSFFNDSAILKTFCFLMSCFTVKIQNTCCLQSHFAITLCLLIVLQQLFLSAAGMLFFPLHVNFLVCLDKIC